MENSDMTLGIPRETLGGHYIFKSGFREAELAGKREVVKWKEWGEERERQIDVTVHTNMPIKHKKRQGTKHYIAEFPGGSVG